MIISPDQKCNLRTVLLTDEMDGSLDNRQTALGGSASRGARATAIAKVHCRILRNGIQKIRQGRIFLLRSSRHLQ